MSKFDLFLVLMAVGCVAGWFMMSSQTKLVDIQNTYLNQNKAPPVRAMLRQLVIFLISAPTMFICFFKVAYLFIDN